MAAGLPLSLPVLLLCSVCAVNLTHGWFFRPITRPQCSPFPQKSHFQKCITCNLFSPKEVTLRVRNVLKEPTFDETVTLNCTRAKTLFFMMQEAADVNSIFRFNTKYFGADLGFFVQGVNDVFGDFALDKSYWEILDGDLKQTPVGVSSYVPKAGETVTFNLTQSGHA